MSSDSPTRLIEPRALTELIETSRGEPALAHTVRRDRPRVFAVERQPSALRGLLIVAASALVLSEVTRWIFF